MAKITRKMIRQDLLDQLERSGKVGAYYSDMVDDYMAFWDIKNELIKDIKERGSVVEYELADGRVKMSKNESVGELQKTNAQMLKILDALEIKEMNGGDVDDDPL